MPADGSPTIPLATARRAVVRLLRALASNPDVLRLGVGGALRRMEPRVPAIEVYVTTLDPEARAEGRIEAAAAALDFVDGDTLEPDLPFVLEVFDELGFEPPPAQALPEGVFAMADVRGAFRLHVLPGRGRHALPMVAARAWQEGYDWAVASLPAARTDALAGLRADVPLAEVLPPTDDEDAAARSAPRVYLAVEAPIVDGALRIEDPDAAADADLVIALPSRSAGETASALSDPRVKVLAHPVSADGAWYERETDDVASWERVLDAAAEHGVALEFSGASRAAWLPDAVHGLARERGVRVLPAADAETLNDIDDQICAVGPLRLAGWRADEVLSARDGAAFEAWLAGDGA